jgi:hypothetical protein
MLTPASNSPHELDFIPDFPTPPASPVPASLFAPISPDTYGTWSTGEPTPPSSPVQDSSSVSLSQVRRRARRGNTHIRVTIKVKVRLSSRPKGSRGNNGGLDHCF